MLAYRSRFAIIWAMAHTDFATVAARKSRASMPITYGKAWFVSYVVVLLRSSATHTLSTEVSMLVWTSRRYALSWRLQALAATRISGASGPTRDQSPAIQSLRTYGRCVGFSRTVRLVSANISLQRDRDG